MPLALRPEHLQLILTHAAGHDTNDAGTVRRVAQRHLADQPGTGQSAFGRMERSRSPTILTTFESRKFPGIQGTLRRTVEGQNERF